MNRQIKLLRFSVSGNWIFPGGGRSARLQCADAATPSSPSRSKGVDWRAGNDGSTGCRAEGAGVGRIGVERRGVARHSFGMEGGASYAGWRWFLDGIFFERACCH